MENVISAETLPAYTESDREYNNKSKLSDSQNSIHRKQIDKTTYLQIGATLHEKE